MLEVKSADKPSLTPYIVLSIVQIMCCSTVTGVIALVFALISNDKFDKGDVNSGTSFLNYSKWTLIIGFAFTAILVLFIICYFVFIIGIAAISTY